MPRPISARFDLSAFRHNLDVARRHASRAKVWAVVKANAYGHGLLRATRAMKDADGFALLDLDEAVRLREAGIDKPILLLEGFFEPGDLAVVERLRLTPVVHDIAQIEMLAQANLATPIPIYLKLDSGMHRLGLAPARWAEALGRARALPSVRGITLMTHFADADGERGVAEQMRRFNEVVDGGGFPCSLANSAALLRYPETHADWVRPGIMLYGCSPFAEQSAETIGLKPVMTLESRVIAVRELKAGDRVGYGGTFTAERPTRVGVVACGYADGYPRHAPTGTPIVVAGRRTRTLGRVSMDMLYADLTGVPDAGVNAPVTLWGESVSADEVATAAGTVSYELLCALAARVPQIERSH